MTSRVRTPSPSAADARRQRYGPAYEATQRAKGDGRTPSHAYDVEVEVLLSASPDIILWHEMSTTNLSATTTPVL